ncbi:heparinase II/III domain-containing protein [Roseivirga sp.]|uniref:heparinase II/III domain-containing protein n=1 Tax=Roseivirga sp. TaxID=1964215 RepID=UPI003B8E7A14
MRMLLAIFLLGALSCSSSMDYQDHPNLILTGKGVQAMRASFGKVPLFDETIETTRAQVDAAIARGIDVPMPKDLAGGYTHERHKSNFFTMQKAGVLFQITQDERYANYIKEMLLQYAEIYPKIDKHPAERSYARGKFFWQCLNDANWLVYTSQAYDCIYDWLDTETITKLNQELFRPYAEFISIENPQFFNRIHNHSTWGNAGVGMIGLVMKDEELVNWALNGLDQKVPGDFVKDNDGGSIQLEGQKEAGFLAQLDHAFSPDGYYTEGPYYQRYAMYPFLIFAQGLANEKPALDILNYRKGLLIKAVDALINQTNAAGEFFPINDAQKGMSLSSRELVNAVSMAYHYGDNDPTLLSIIAEQGKVPLNDSGLAAAEAIAQGNAKPYEYKSMELTDGANGDEGAIGILRKGQLTLMMKYAKHGMGHGHFDRLGFLLYNDADEVIQDYGSARWVNIEHKDGGGYLKENTSWAKQTLAHNTLVVNKDSHFDGKVDVAEKSSGTPYFFSSAENLKIVSAKELNAYEDVQMQRTMGLVDIDELENPLVIDMFSVFAPAGTRYDLPVYYQGELMSTNHNIEIQKDLIPMGQESGYQHLWLEGQMDLQKDAFSMTWFNKKNFYSITSAVEAGDKALLTRIGANDPNFNLRRDAGLIQRRTGGNTLFANLYEVHGRYNYSDEIPINSFSSIASVEVLHHSADYAVISIILKSGASYLFAFSQENADENQSHSLQLKDEKLEWTGPTYFSKRTKN